MKCLPVRRWGSNATHLADVPEDLPVEAVIFKTPCRVINSSVSTVCGTLLRAKDSGYVGDSIIVMDGWGSPKALGECPRCKRLRPDPAASQGRNYLPELPA